jgi:hypothetical protein
MQKEVVATPSTVRLYIPASTPPLKAGTALKGAGVTMRFTTWEGSTGSIVTDIEALALIALAKPAANITSCNFFMFFLSALNHREKLFPARRPSQNAFLSSRDKHIVFD